MDKLEEMPVDLDKSCMEMGLTISIYLEDNNHGVYVCVHELCVCVCMFVRQRHAGELVNDCSCAFMATLQMCKLCISCD